MFNDVQLTANYKLYYVTCGKSRFTYLYQEGTFFPPMFTNAVPYTKEK